MLIGEINLQQVLDEFIEEQQELLTNDVSEQAISHQLAMKLAPLFDSWHIDCEYNRNGTDIKKLKYAVAPDGSASERNVTPDVIIHHRNTNENLLAIEIKKSTNQEQSFKDLAKLEAFKKQLGYQFTLFVRFQTGSESVAIQEIQWQ